MAITRAYWQNQLVPGLNALLGFTYRERARDNQHLAIYGQPDKSSRAYEESTMNATLGLAQLKADAGAMFVDEGAGEMWKARVDMKTYALRFTISRETVMDNQYMNPAKALTKAMAIGLAERKQYEAAGVLNNATSSSYLGGDGKALCATDHPTKDAGTNSNLLTVAADLNEASIEDALLQVQDWVTQRGVKINPQITGVVAPKGYTFILKRLAVSDGRVSTTDNDANVHKGMPYAGGKYSINNYLTDADAWFLTTDVPDGLKYFQREGVVSVQETNFETQNFQYGAMERYGFGWFDPLGVFMSAGA